MVRKAYLDDIKGIEVQKPGEEGPMDNPPKDQPIIPQPNPQSLILSDLLSFRDGGLELKLPKEKIKEMWNKAKRMIDIYLEGT